MTSTLTIGKLAKAVGVNIETIRYYERRKLLRTKTKSPSGYRLYDDEALRKLRFIKNAQTLGFTLKEICELLNLRTSSTASCRGVQGKAQARLMQVKEKVRELQALARTLRGLIQTCRAGQSTNGCPILTSLEKAPRTRRLK
jgi:MerR family copper efflux transcriptional regulator